MLGTTLEGVRLVLLCLLHILATAISYWYLTLPLVLLAAVAYLRWEKVEADKAGKRPPYIIWPRRSSKYAGLERMPLASRQCAMIDPRRQRPLHGARRDSRTTR